MQLVIKLWIQVMHGGVWESMELIETQVSVC